VLHNWFGGGRGVARSGDGVTPLAGGDHPAAFWLDRDGAVCSTPQVRRRNR